MPPVDCAVEMPELLEVRQVAATLQCSTRHVYRLSSAGQMPAPCKLGTLVRWRRRAVEEWIENGCTLLGVSSS
jgi:excisionase family DNA binding protein